MSEAAALVGFLPLPGIGSVIVLICDSLRLHP
jgi:hypothetical protein